jgi:hypothetical protein
MSYTSGPWRRLREKAHALETEWATKKEEREADEAKRATDAMEAARTLVTTYLQDEAHWMLDEKTGEYTCEVCDDLFPDLTDAQFLLLANWWARNAFSWSLNRRRMGYSSSISGRTYPWMTTANRSRISLPTHSNR